MFGVKNKSKVSLNVFLIMLPENQNLFNERLTPFEQYRTLASGMAVGP